MSIPGYTINNQTISLSVPNSSPYFEGISYHYNVWPGMAVERSVWEPPEPFYGLPVEPQGYSSITGERLFAVENPYDGGSIQTPYLKGDEGGRVMMRAMRPGDVVLGIYYQAGVVGDLAWGQVLVATGGLYPGTLRKRINETDSFAMALALEAVVGWDIGSVVRIRMQII